MPFAVSLHAPCPLLHALSLRRRQVAADLFAQGLEFLNFRLAPRSLLPAPRFQLHDREFLNPRVGGCGLGVAGAASPGGTGVPPVFRKVDRDVPIAIYPVKIAPGRRDPPSFACFLTTMSYWGRSNFSSNPSG